VLEVLPFGREQVASVRLVPRDPRARALARQLLHGFKNVEEPWGRVVVELNPEAAAALADASRRYPLHQVRISRPGFPLVEPLMGNEPIEGGRFGISVFSKAEGEQLVNMLGAVCN